MISPQYLAGLIDGDGYLGIIKTKSENRIGYSIIPMVSINLVSSDKLLEEICNKYGGIIYKRKKTYGKNHRPVTYYNIRYSSIKPILIDVAPYLNLKKKRAYLLLEFLKYQSPGNTPDEYRFKQVEIYNKMKILNKRGRKKPELFKLDKLRLKKRSLDNVFTPEEVKELYWEKNMSLSELVDHFGVSYYGLYHYMVRHNIPRRSDKEAVTIKRKQKLKLRVENSGQLVIL